MSAQLNEIIQSIHDLLGRFSAKNNQLKMHPTSNSLQLKLDLIGLPGNHLVSEYLSLYSIKTTFLDNDWWNGLPNNFRSAIHPQSATDQYVIHQKAHFFVSYYSAIESNLRVIQRYLLPGRCQNGFASFDSIYKCLFKHLNLSLYIELYDICRCTRNLIHNNGTYIDSRQMNRSYTWNNTTYDFIHTQPVSFAYAENLFDLKSALFESIVDIVDNPNFP